MEFWCSKFWSQRRRESRRIHQKAGRKRAQHRGANIFRSKPSLLPISDLSQNPFGSWISSSQHSNRCLISKYLLNYALILVFIPILYTFSGASTGTQSWIPSLQGRVSGELLTALYSFPYIIFCYFNSCLFQLLFLDRFSVLFGYFGMEFMRN